MTKQSRNFITYLQSQQTSQQYLYKCYKRLDYVDPSVKSFENCHQFMHYLEHGIRFYENGKKLETLMQPMLFFYGMVHLLKAVLLTVRPNYPESTSILAHGVSSRKRKKKNYSFLDDEVKIQHNGLYPYVSQHLFAIEEIPFKKINMEQLLVLIPELLPLFTYQDKEKMVHVGDDGTQHLQFPTRLLDNYHLTANALIKRIKPYLPAIIHQKTEDVTVHIELATSFSPSYNSPFFTNMKNKAVYFPAYREEYMPVSEIMVHYLLLYNLSMLCRYETEWWGDLLAVKADMDYPFIKAFLETTAEKIPLMLEQFLLHMKDKTNNKCSL